MNHLTEYLDTLERHLEALPEGIRALLADLDPDTFQDGDLTAKQRREPHGKKRKK